MSGLPVFLLVVMSILANTSASGQAAPAQKTKSGGPVGIFEGHGDIGEIFYPGSVTFDDGKYTVIGSGANMWFREDQFHFAWKKASGDLMLTADIDVGPGKEPHRKGCLMIRQNLEPDSPYVDVVLHGDGLASLQFRHTKGDNAHEVQATVTAPRRLRLEKRGKYVRMYLAAKGEELYYSGAAVRIEMKEPFYVGIGACAHNKALTVKVDFSNLELETDLPTSTRKPTLYSTLETQTINSTDRRVVFVTPKRIEAPNWMPDGKSLIYNSGGRLYRISVAGGKPEMIDTGFATKCNNDHGVSPDGKLLAISDQSQGKRQSLIYTVPITGGTPKLITPNGPSYWHGWSPDGKTLAYCAERGGEYDVYTIPVEGGQEKRLTTAKGLEDGPEYSPDGKHIYFNSDRTGRMHIWRMRSDGSQQEQITNDDYNNWFPHPSPDGKKMIILSYEKDITGHPADKEVLLRIMSLDTQRIEVLARILGGQGTINVPCWSPDGRRIAFVSYQWVE